MNIAYVARQSFAPGVDGHLGGIGRYAETMSLGLADLGANITVFSQGPDARVGFEKRKDVRIVYLPKWENDSGLSWRLKKLEHALLRTRLGQRAWGALSDKIRRALIVNKYLPLVAEESSAPFDVVEFAECGAEGLFYLQRKKRPPCIVRIHCPTQLLQENNHKDVSLGDRLLVHAERFSARSADVVSSPSRSAAELAKTCWKLTRAEPLIIPNLYNSEVFHGAERPGPGKAFTIVYSGRLERLKGVMMLPSILSRLREFGLSFQVRLVGNDTNTAPGNASMRDWLIQAVDPQIRERLVFTGQLGEHRLVRELQQADVGLYLSQYETFGYTVLEAQACGLPVIATGNSGLEEIVVNGATGFLVDAADHETIAALLVQLHDDAELRDRLGAAAREHARERYSLEKGCPMFLDFYSSVAETVRPGEGRRWGRA